MLSRIMACAETHSAIRKQELDDDKRNNAFAFLQVTDGRYLCHKEFLTLASRFAGVKPGAHITFCTSFELLPFFVWKALDFVRRTFVHVVFLDSARFSVLFKGVLFSAICQLEANEHAAKHKT